MLITVALSQRHNDDRNRVQSDNSHDRNIVYHNFSCFFPQFKISDLDERKVYSQK